MSNVRTFVAKPAVLGEVPMLIGLVGPPGGGKTWSALRLATGMRRLRPGPVVLVDTERGRARKYARNFEFLHVPFDPPFKPTDFLQAVRDQLKLNPAAVIVDSLSDEHEGEGGVIDWHDAMVEKFKGNEHAAWGPPKADRKRMIAGFLQIVTPLIFTFRAREKTVQQAGRNGKREVVNIGWQPVAPMEIVHALDLTCLLPPRAEGVPAWRSERVGESFIVKLPEYLKPYIQEGRPLSEDMGEAFARWAQGGEAPPALDKSEPAPNPRLLALHDAARRKAAEGSFALNAWIDRLKPVQKSAVGEIQAELDRLADDADAASDLGADLPDDTFPGDLPLDRTEAA